MRQYFQSAIELAASIEQAPERVMCELDRFLARQSSLTPRKYVSENLSMKGSADIYSDYYFSLLR